MQEGNADAFMLRCDGDNRKRREKKGRGRGSGIEKEREKKRLVVFVQQGKGQIRTEPS